MNHNLPPRRLVPRWRKATYAIHQPDMLGMVKPLKGLPKLVTDPEDVLRAVREWNTSNAVGDLADALSYGVDSSFRSILDAPARAALVHPGATPAMRLVAREILEAGTSQSQVWHSAEANVEVQTLRAVLRLAPNDVIALVDLAQHHLACGKAKAAYRALATAYQLSPHSVHVVRAFARYWIHLGMPDRAHAFIKSSGLAATDPWVMASEIAISQAARAQSSQLRRAQRLLATKEFKPTDFSELAGAVAGAEISTGNFKEARKLFRMALEHPNDNVLAQAITSQNFIGIEIDEQVIRRAPNGAFEGRALNAMIAGDFEAATGFTESWSSEEPFSSRPRLLQAYFFGAMGEYEKALDAANHGLISDPGDESLRANRAYALAGLGRFAEAAAELRQLEARDAADLRPSLLATRGMILMLTGRTEEGIQSYETAIEEFQKAKREEQVTDCMAFMARTALVAGIEQRDALTQRATERFRKIQSPAASVILMSMKQVVPNLEAPALRKTVQWEWDQAANTLSERKELSRKGGSGIVITKKRK